MRELKRKEKKRKKREGVYIRIPEAPEITPNYFAARLPAPEPYPAPVPQIQGTISQPIQYLPSPEQTRYATKVGKVFTQQEEAIKRGAVPTTRRLEIEELEKRRRGPDVEFLKDKAKLTFDVSKIGESPEIKNIILTETQLKDYQKGDIKDPLVQEALDYKAFMSDISIAAGEEIARLRGEAAVGRITPREELYVPPLPKMVGAEILGATFRESLFPVVASGLGAGITAAALAAAAAAGGTTAATIVGLPVAPVAAIGAFLITAATLTYATYRANEKEATAHLRKMSMLTRTTATIIPTMMNRPGGIGKFQAQINIISIREQINYEIDLAYRGREEGTLAGDLGDADGLISQLILFRDQYLPMIEFQIMQAAADPNYIPEVVDVPGITVPEIEK